MVLGACKPVDVLPCFVHVQGVRETATIIGFLEYPWMGQKAHRNEGEGVLQRSHHGSQGGDKR